MQNCRARQVAPDQAGRDVRTHYPARRGWPARRNVEVVIMKRDAKRPGELANPTALRRLLDETDAIASLGRSAESVQGLAAQLRPEDTLVVQAFSRLESGLREKLIRLRPIVAECNSELTEVAGILGGFTPYGDGVTGYEAAIAAADSVCAAIDLACLRREFENPTDEVDGGGDTPESMIQGHLAAIQRALRTISPVSSRGITARIRLERNEVEKMSSGHDAQPGEGGAKISYTKVTLAEAVAQYQKDNAILFNRLAVGLEDARGEERRNLIKQAKALFSRDAIAKAIRAKTISMISSDPTFKRIKQALFEPAVVHVTEVAACTTSDGADKNPYQDHKTTKDPTAEAAAKNEMINLARKKLPPRASEPIIEQLERGTTTPEESKVLIEYLAESAEALAPDNFVTSRTPS
jgi:hypothetical protein